MSKKVYEIYGYMDTHLHYRKAFTLIEIILVILLVAVLSGIAMPRFGATVRYQQLNETGKNLVSQIKFARKLAVFSNQKVSIVFDEETNRFLLQCFKRADLQKPLKMGRNVLSVPKKYVVDAEPVIINFYPTGLCDSYSILIRDSKTLIQCRTNQITGDPEIISKENI